VQLPAKRVILLDGAQILAFPSFYTIFRMLRRESKMLERILQTLQRDKTLPLLQSVICAETITLIACIGLPMVNA
jgi:hypothetical protein